MKPQSPKTYLPQERKIITSKTERKIKENFNEIEKIDLTTTVRTYIKAYRKYAINSSPSDENYSKMIRMLKLYKKLTKMDYKDNREDFSLWIENNLK